MQEMKTIEPCVVVIFGASGNLSRLKLIPALFRLELAGRLPEKTAILGCSLEPWDDRQWIEEVSGMLQSKFPEGLDEQAFERFRARLHYHPNPPDSTDSYLKLQKLPAFLPIASFIWRCALPSFRQLSTGLAMSVCSKSKKAGAGW